MVKRTTILSIILFAVIGLFGQSTFLDELKRSVIERDLQIQKLEAEIERIDYEIDATRHQYSPNVSMSYRKYFLEYMEEEIGDERTETRASLQLQQNLTTTFVTTPAEVEKKQNERERLADRIDELVRRREAGILDEYLKLLILKRQADAYTMLDTTSNREFDMVKRRYYFGEILRDDFVKSSRDIERIHTRRDEYNSKFIATLDLFAAKYRLDPDKIPFEDYSEYHSLPDFSTLLDSLYSYYRARGERQLGYQAEIDQYRYNTLRDINLSIYGGYNWYEYGSGIERDNLEAGARISFPLTLLTFPRHNKRLRDVSQRYVEIENQERLEENIDDLIRLYADCESKLKDIDYLRIERDIAMERMKIASIRTENWRSLDMHKAQLDYQQAKIEYEIGRMELERAIMSLAYATFLPLSVFEEQAVSSGQETSNGVWVWNTSELLASGKANRILQTCTKHRIDRVFFSFPSDVMRKLDTGSKDLIDLISNLHRHKIQISALFAENSWLMPSKRQELGKRIEQILRYNAIASEENRIDGIHLDIEPQGLDVWDADRVMGLRLLRETLQYVKRLVGDQIRIEVDLAPFLDEEDAGYLKSIIPYVDEITLMAYQKTLEDILVKVYNEMSDTEDGDVPVLVGIDVNKFDHEDQLQESLDMLRNKLSVFRNFRGMALHDYNNLINIRTQKDESEKKR